MYGESLAWNFTHKMSHCKYTVCVMPYSSDCLFYSGTKLMIVCSYALLVKVIVFLWNTFGKGCWLHENYSNMIRTNTLCDSLAWSNSIFRSHCNLQPYGLLSFVQHGMNFYLHGQRLTSVCTIEWCSKKCNSHVNI